MELLAIVASFLHDKNSELIYFNNDIKWHN